MDLRELTRKLGDASSRLGMPRRDVERALGNAIVSQAFFSVAEELSIPAYLKGGSGQIWRLGILQARATRDIDLVTAAERSEVHSILAGMVGFRIGSFELSEVIVMSDRTTSKVPESYRILVAKVRLKVKDSPWISCELEVLPLEESDSHSSVAASLEMARLLLELGLTEDFRFPLISLELQVAEKLHALTEPGSDRAGDLFDIALILRLLPLNIEALREEVGRVFARRATHSLDAAWVPGGNLRIEYLDIADEAGYESAVEKVRRLLISLGY